ncbi:ATP-binding protein [Rhodobacteraceae bacterium RKSG542]|uniref:DNA-packaging protein n=1 Tax=Pseudovibrio flavus TaxID=2529854 RepID=UPI0012BC6EA2|nr:terminase family protein [Pseudovibrio flavus]MTI17066.1 ATP-binding protein [Pseudovibrio flavus]
MQKKKDVCAKTLRTALRRCVERSQAVDLLEGLSLRHLRFLQYEWLLFAHDHQLPPEGDWLTWLIMGGRGSGKTRAGAEWVRGLASCSSWAGNERSCQIALIGQTYADVREVMIEGPSGLLAIHRKDERPVWSTSRRRLEWSNGAVARAFSSEDPEALRGPQFHWAWCDEVGKWSNADDTYAMLQFGLRLGAQPRQLFTTTPRQVPLLKTLLADKGTRVTRASTKDNAAHLAPGFLDVIWKQYGGTRLGRQEIDGHLLEDREDGLFLRKWFDEKRVRQAPELARIIIAIDPPVTSKRSSDACGIVAVGVCEGGDAYVLADRSIQGARPQAWGQRAVKLYHELCANEIVAEVNQGGEMVREIIAQVDPSVPVKSVFASRSKQKRAEPVALLYEQGRVAHVGALNELEDEMVSFCVSDRMSGKRSPDRMDALVWAVSELLLAKTARPQMHVL